MSCISSIGIANPTNKIKQLVVEDFMAMSMVGGGEKTSRVLSSVYSNSNIEHRHSVLSDFERTDNFEVFKEESIVSVEERMQIYKKNALPLAKKAIQNCLDNTNINAEDITHLIVVSCTGMYAPGLDIELTKALKLRKNVERTCVNFMGCYAAFNGLKIGNQICENSPNAKVLVLCVELCTIHFQREFTQDNVVANAIFADGAACVLLEHSNSNTGNRSLEISSNYCDLAFQGEESMAWEITSNGFQMVLSSYISVVIKEEIEGLLNKALKQAGLVRNEIDYFAIHPGGNRILDAISQTLDLEKSDLRYSLKVLNDYGNMSSCTVLFVLREILSSVGSEDIGKNVFSCAFGPGLTLESMIFKIS